MNRYTYIYPYQDGLLVDGPTARPESPPEELAQTAVVLQILNGGLLYLASKCPNVRPQHGLTQRHRQLQIVDIPPQARQDIQRKSSVDLHLERPRI